jgi:diguanylate cyclase (GGDEF)-like protein
LTRLPNRRLLQDRMGLALIASDRSGHYGALLYLDLDSFKNLNDTRGHDVGDQMLIETARRIQGQVRQADCVSRQGGDEFLVMLLDLSEDAEAAALQAREVGEKIRRTLAIPYDLDGREFHSSASLGVALFCGHRETVETLLRHADLAMYKAKRTGGNLLQFFDPAMQQVLDQRSALEADLRMALERAQLCLYYQPQLDTSGRVTGAEALLRWAHHTRGLVLPAEFIPLAEETGLILPIGQWVLANACEQIKLWSSQDGMGTLRIAVNISARQFRQPDFVDQVVEILAATGADAHQLELELTESQAVDNVDDTVAHMCALGALGVGFSMDDFGTGFSSLSYLKRLPLDQLKIDAAFVRDVAHSRDDAAIVQTIIAMGKTLGLEVIAEGVETPAQEALLRGFGCLMFQGYLYAQPLALADFEALRANLRLFRQSETPATT